MQAAIVFLAAESSGIALAEARMALVNGFAQLFTKRKGSRKPQA